MTPRPTIREVHPMPKVGDYVRFAHLPAGCEPRAYLVTEVLPNGMIRLLGWTGHFAAHLLVVVDGPKEAA